MGIWIFDAPRGTRLHFCPMGVAAVETGGKQQSPGLLHLDGSSPARCKKIKERLLPLLYLPVLKYNPHPYRMRPQIKGLSHGLKKCPPDTFLPALQAGRPFESLPGSKKADTRMGICFFGTPEGTRTPNPRNRNPMLYPLSHRRICFTAWIL